MQKMGGLSTPIYIVTLTQTGYDIYCKPKK